MSICPPPDTNNGLKRKHSSLGSSRVEDIAWTTARCNRLLRTIDSRIEAIRNLIRPDLRAHKTASRPEIRIRKRKPESLTDPLWLPEGSKKIKPRTYAAKDRPKIDRTVRNGGTSNDGRVHTIVLPSPFLKRVQQPPTVPLQASPALDHMEPTLVQHRMRRQLPIKIQDPTEKAEVALRSAFQNFLRITQATNNVSRRGARSLLGTCLRQVPRYLESQMEPSYDGEDVDGTIASDVWSFFDDLLNIKGSDWQGLREVARSQGIDAVRRAILDQSLSDSCIDKLIRDCIELSALPEVEILISAWLEASEVTSLTKTGLLDTESLWRGLEGIRFRVLTRFVSQDRTRISALLTGHKHMWNTLLRAITQGAQDEALQFLQLCIESVAADACVPGEMNSYHRQMTKNMDEVASKLCIMACTSLLLDETSRHGVQLRQGLFRLGMSLLANNHIRVNRLAVPWLAGPIVLAALTGSPSTLASHSRDIKEACDRVARDVLYRREAERCTQDFAQSIACGFFSLDIDKDLDIVGPVFSRIKEHMTASSSSKRTERTILRTIATELITRRRLNNDCTDETDDTWQMPKTPSAFQTPRAKASKFGWDDDLCEWVAKTPFTQAEPSGPGSVLADDKENEEPETPDVLTRTIMKTPGIEQRRQRALAVAAQCLLPQRPTMMPKSPRVIIARPTKRRKSGRIKAREIEDESEDELAL